MKTGTSFLQQEIFPELIAPKFVGWCGKRGPSEWLDDKFSQIVSYVNGDKPHYDQSPFNYRFPILLSDESILGHDKPIEKIAKRIKSINPSGPNKIIFAFREQSAYLLSRYWQFKRGVTGPKSHAPQSLDEWFSGLNIEQSLCYDNVVEDLIYHFGIENVWAYPYELMANDFEKFLKHFLMFTDGHFDKSLSDMCVKRSIRIHDSNSLRRFRRTSQFIHYFRMEKTIRRLIPFGRIELVLNSHYARKDVLKCLSESIPKIELSNKKLSGIISSEYSLNDYGYLGV